MGGSIAICEGMELYPPKSYFLTRHTGELCGSVFWIKLNQRFHLQNPEEEKYISEIEKCIYNVGIANQKGRMESVISTGWWVRKTRFMVPMCRK